MSNYSKILEEWNAEQENRKALLRSFCINAQDAPMVFLQACGMNGAVNLVSKPVKNISLLLNLGKVKLKQHRMY